MSDRVRPEDIDPIIHERVRLAICSALAVAPELSFGELKSTLSLTDGNLSAHARTLDEAGYIVIEKTFQGPPTVYDNATEPQGRKAFSRYVDTLRKIIEEGDARDNDSS